MGSCLLKSTDQSAKSQTQGLFAILPPQFFLGKRFYVGTFLWDLTGIEYNPLLQNEKKIFQKV